MKKFVASFVLIAVLVAIPGAETVRAESEKVHAEKLFGKKRKNRGYQKPRSKKILGIFKRKSDCGCPNH